jgi:hypothetical protein
VALRRLALLLAAACLLAGCGEEAAGDGTAQLWISRDRGAEVIVATSVPAGISAMEALRRKADIETRHGGRFVQSIDGLDGDIGEQQDWFFFVNGYEADLSAADYELHDGDVLWWDYRSWAREMREPVVVGAFPEPFVHGWNGERRPAVVVSARDDPLARRMAALVRGKVNGPKEGANVLILEAGSSVRAELTGGPGDPVTFHVGRERAAELVRDPTLIRFAYEVS